MKIFGFVWVPPCSYAFWRTEFSCHLICRNEMRVGFRFLTPRLSTSKPTLAGGRGAVGEPTAPTAEGMNFASSTSPFGLRSLLLRRHLPRDHPLTAGDAHRGAKASVVALRMRRARAHPRHQPRIAPCSALASYQPGAVH